MATIAQKPFAAQAPDERFFLRAAVLMTIVIIAGFSMQWLAGRSTFHAPMRVHLHAIVFMGWVAIYLIQNVSAASAQMNLHRKLGWIAALWLVPMIIVGSYATVAMVRAAQVPFVFRPLHFLIFDLATLLGFVGLTLTAILMRKQTGWHRRLHFCAMSLLLMPAIGRLLPMPLLMPFAWETAFALSLLFPFSGIFADWRRSRAAHPAWGWGIATMLSAFIFTEAATYTPMGTFIYRAATLGSPGATVSPLSFPAPPTGP
ncbi:hypothetical protein ACFQPG_11075 [Sphingomonas sp. GCM10030256]|uniref:hypothetical protein n=1 Tax=Sphingomonas sp. GCM10030256 TaxID=3273427 RepID=UPI00361F1B21